MNRTDPKPSSATLTNPQTPNKSRRPLGVLSAQAASVRSVPESPSPTKPISLEHAHLKMRPTAPAMRPNGTRSPIGRSQSQLGFAMPAPPSRLPQPPSSPTRSVASNSSGPSLISAFRQVPPPMNYSGYREFSNGSEDTPSQTSENWEAYDEGSEPEEEYDTPRAIPARRLGFEGMFPNSPTRQRRNSSVNSAKTRMFIQQQSQRGQDLISELMEEVQEVDDEWGEEGF